MADWVHCNICFTQPGGESRKFSLTSCGHVYCSNCLTEGTREKCQMCQSPCTFIQLTSRMKPEVEIFFTDPSQIANKAHKQLVQVLDFQRNHRQRLHAHKRQQDNKHRSILETAHRKLEEIQKLEREVFKLREENNKLRNIITASPGPGGAAVHRSPVSGRVMYGSSPTSQSTFKAPGKTPSPSKSRHISPYPVKSPFQLSPVDTNRSLHSAQIYAGCTPPGPARVSVRTPPVNGRIGTVGTPTSLSMSIGRPLSASAISSTGWYTPGSMDLGSGRGSMSPLGVSPGSNRSNYTTPQRTPPTNYSLSQPTTSSRYSDQITRQLHENQKIPLISTPGMNGSYSMSQR